MKNLILIKRTNKIYRFGYYQKLIILLTVFIASSLCAFGQVPASPGAIFGTTLISPGTTSSAYSISPESGVTGYSWSIEPGYAGTITASNTQATVTWSSSYFGNATIMVSGVNNSGTGPPSTLTVTINSGSLQPAVATGSQTINYDDIPTGISATAATGGNGTITYQWQSSTGGGAYVPISGATGLACPTSALTATTSYQLVATSNSISVTSNTVVVTVYPQLIPAANTSVSQTANNGTPITVALTATAASGGNGTYAYQWQYATTGSGPNANWVNISSADSLTYTFTNSFSVTDHYRIATTSNGQTKYSVVNTITVIPLTASIISPSRQEIYPGSSASHLTATAATGGGGNYTYQWQSTTSISGANWSSIFGATGLNYNPTPYGSLLDSTTYYRLQVMSGGDTVLSNIDTVVVSTCLPLNTMASGNMNYIQISEPRISGIVNNPGLANRSSCDLMQTIEYFDGLGKPLETIQVAGSQNGNDVIQPFSYDHFGRDSIKYLPYSSDTPTPGAYQTNAPVGTSAYLNSPQYQFYVTNGSDHVNTQYPYSATNYEPSPQNRVIEQGFPGISWQLSNSNMSNSGHTVNISYTSNDQSVFSSTVLTNNPGSHMVALYTATVNTDGSRNLVRTGGNATYNTGQLKVTIRKDENWNPATDGCLSSTEEYKDMDGHIVLKRTYNQKGNALQMLSTYYVYDDLGLLAFVLPPAANPDSAVAIANTTLNNLCYQYQYDEKNRLTQKKVPGKGWEYMVYNNIDQVVGTQDSLQRAASEWIYTKYDAVGRAIMTGIWTNNGSPMGRSALQNSLEAINTNLWEAPITTGYTSVAWPVNSTTPLTTNYFDGYANIPSLPAAYVLSGTSTNPTNQLRGLQTASQTAVLNTLSDILWNVNYYDNYARPVQSYKQHYLGGVANVSNYDVISSTYNFTDEVTVVTRKHFTAANTSIPMVTINNQYDYDHVGRKVATWVQLQNGALNPDTRTLLSIMDYNEIGQPLTKAQHSTDSVNFLQYVSFAYNERGWLNSSSALLFSVALNYDEPGIAPQYNGNIASQLWGTYFNLSNRFNYSYDRLNRLTSGTSKDNSNIERGISYDVMGNINTLTRVYNNVLIDSLNYSYNSANQLQKVSDLSTDASGIGYKKGNWGYNYDGNGNMITDSSKAISFTYNLLNLPKTIAALNTTYVYDAEGRKLRRIIGTSTTDYIDGIEYDNGSISFIQTEEGRALPNGAINYNYEYNIGDHLGNIRLTFDSATGLDRIVQQDNYMPFGMDIPGDTAYSPRNLYLYNKKELQANVQLFDYGARFYDPVIARWTAVDPLAEKSRRFSPYNYGENNPILNIDPDGMETQGSGCCGTPILFPATQKIAKAAAKLVINTVAFFTNFIDAENSHRAFSKDPAVRAEAKKELNGYLAAGAVMVMTDGLMGRIAGTFGTSVTSNSVWALDASERGFAVEQMLGGNLPYGFPVIDKFNPETGVATSIKSIDVTADSYTKGNGLFNTLKSYVNKLDGFQGATRGNFSVEGGDITSKVLEVGIQPGKATLSQWEQIGNAMKYAKDNNINFKLQFVK